MVKIVGKWVKRHGPKLSSDESAPAEPQTIGRTSPRELVILAVLGLAVIVAFSAAFVRVQTDRGIRLWMLNHGPDQLVVVNPDTGEVEKELLVADGLQQVVFNHSKDTAFVANVVDVSNRVTLIDTRSYLKSEQITVDGVPQGLAVFPDDERLAVITGSKTDFMAGGFDVLDLTQQSAADPQRKRAIYRERNLSLTAFIAVDESGENVYCLDAKASHVFIFSMEERKLVCTVDIGAAPMGLLYPEWGEYFFVSSIKDKAITVLRKARDPQDVDIAGKVEYGRFRHMALSHDGRLLYAPVYELMEIAVIDVEALEVVNIFKIDEGCSLIAVSPMGDDIYAVGYTTGNVYVLDAGSGALKRTITTHGEFRDIKVILESDKPSLKAGSGR
jgi:DNA-binding beta-propeller fold protein YncE